MGLRQTTIIRPDQVLLPDAGPGGPRPVLSWLSISIGILCGTAAAACAWTGMVLHPGYPDFVPGLLAWQDATKLEDLVAALVFVAVAPVGLLLTARLDAAVACRGDGAATDAWRGLMLCCLAPAAFVVGRAMAGQLTAFFPALGLAAALLAALFTLRALRSRSRPTVDRTWVEAAGQGVAAVGLGALLPFALALAVARVGQVPLLEPAAIGRAGLLAAGLTTILVLRGDPAQIRRLLALTQLGLPLFFFALIPPRFLEPGAAGPLALPVRWTLPALAWGLVLLGLGDALRRLRHAVPVSPLALAGLVCLLALSPVPIPLVPADDYHFGESLVPFWQWQQFGIRPYLDYTPAHGLLDYLPGALSALFLDGTAASTAAWGNRIGVALLSTALTCTLALPLGRLPTLVLMAGLVQPTVDLSAYSVILLGLCLLLRPDLLQRPRAWLCAVCGIVLGLVLVTPGQGGGAILALLPFSLWLLVLALRTDRRRTLATAGLMLAVLALLAMLTPTGGMMIGAVRYALENSRINLVAWAIPWRWSLPPAGTGDDPLFQALRLGWMVVPVLAVATLVWLRQQPAESLPRRRIALAGSFALLFPLAILSYSLGRIDPAGASRTGVVTLVAVALLLPLMLFPLAGAAGRGALLLLAALVAGVFTRAPTLGALNNAIVPVVATPAPLTRGAEIGLPALGTGLTQPDHIARILELKRIADAVLAPGEGLLDLTNRNAHYFYLGRPVPIEAGAPLNLAHTDQQRRAVARLMAEPPPLVILSADNLLFDNQIPALRAHLLYRFVLDTYVPVKVGTRILGVLPDRLDRLAGLAPPRPPMAADHTDPNWVRGISRHRAGFFMAEESQLAGLSPGQTVTLARSGPRRVVAIDGRNVWLEGGLLDPDGDGFPHPIGLPAGVGLSGQQAERERHLILFDAAFRQADLQRLPAAWGRSFDRLRPLMRPVRQPAVRPPAARDGRFTLDLGGAPLDGRTAGLLTFTLTCRHEQGEAAADSIPVTVGWQGRMPGWGRTLAFSARPGINLLPLDSQPRWLLTPDLTSLTLDIAGPACPQAALADVTLFQRTAVPQAGTAGP